MLKFWFFFCLAFAFHSLDTLVEESYEVIYEKSNQTEPVQFLVCEKLEDLFQNRTEIDLKKLRERLYEHLNSSIRRSYPSSYFQDWSNKLQKLEEQVLNQTKAGSYLLLNRRACYIAKSKTECENIGGILSNQAEYLAFNRDTFDFTKLTLWSNSIEQLTVFRKSHPYSDCSKSNARFRCLNECFKRRLKLAKYFYDGNETGLIHLNYSDRNRTIEENEKNCFGECKKDNCKFVQLISTNRPEEPTETFEAQPKLSAFNYWVQYVGLLCSFAGLSFQQFASTAIEFAQSKVRRRKVRIALVCLKFGLLFFGLAAFGCLCTWTVLEHKAEANNPTEKKITRTYIQPKTVHLAICVDISAYVGSNYEEMTMSEIEWSTDETLDVVLEDISLDYGERSFPTDHHVHPKTIFKDSKRCFHLSIHLNYQLIPSSPALSVKFKKDTHQLYLLSENEDLNQRSYQYFGMFAFQKRIVKRLKSSGKCIDYEEKYENCTSRWHCVDRCINRSF